MTRNSTGILIRMNLLCSCSDIYNKRIHTKNYFHTSKSIPTSGESDEMGCCENQNSSKSGNLSNNLNSCENTLLYKCTTTTTTDPFTKRHCTAGHAMLNSFL